MRRLPVEPRPGWQEIAEENGFFFHHVDGEIYWDESACYALSLEEIEKGLEDPAQELADMCLDLAADIVNSEELLQSLAIPVFFWDMIRDSWQRNEPSLYGRFDFAFDGHGPAKLYEYNADTPTALYEAAYFQWAWLEDSLKLGTIPQGSDQFNSIQERMVECFSSFKVPGLMHFASMKDTEEDRATVEYIRDCAAQAGVKGKQIFMEDIGVDENGLFVDPDGVGIYWLFKLYPWEFMWRDEFASYLPKSDTTFVEPAWKMVLSNKGMLPLLWERHKGHPNLLPAWFHNITSAPPVRDYVLKPLLSREGANIHVYKDHSQVFASTGEYGAEGYIGQELCPPPFVDGHGPVCGVWIVGGKSCGLGIREDKSP
ncbi:glutathionylspermidine synthase family protein, partial [Desulfovibrio sp. OttesenSCG-928-A18]|nr:glutathionylspermidine synthase family protein [Desulfovibrio sp. OttesenSCG-928-A18]